jgi:hypothetical protein
MISCGVPEVGVSPLLRLRGPVGLQRDRALEAAEEFVALYERLHAQLPQAFGDDLSGAMRTLAELLHLW